MSEFDFSDKEMVVEKLKELKERNIPKMSLEKLMSMDRFKWVKSYVDEATEEEINVANKELSKYCEYGYNDGKDILATRNAVSIGD